MNRVWLCFASCVALSGCIVEVTFDPVGTAASAEGGWTLNGAAPTAESCSALNIAYVRVRFFEGARTSDHPDLVFPCADGEFDTRPDRVVADGMWTMALVAIDADGNQIAIGPMETFDTSEVAGHIALTPVDFAVAPATALAGSWTIDGAPPTQASCDAAGIVEVDVQFIDSSGTIDPTSTRRYPCATGSFNEGIDPGTYTIRVVALDDADAAFDTQPDETFTIAEGEVHTVHGGTPIDYASVFDPSGSDAALMATWRIGGNDASADACSAAGAASVDVVLYAADDAARLGGVAIATAGCDAGTYESGGAIVAAGSYLVSAVLKDAAGNVVSTADGGEAVIVTAGSPLVVTIDFRLASAKIHVRTLWHEPASGAPSACSGAGVMASSWRLDYLASGGSVTTVASSGGEVACVDVVDVTGEGAPLEPGTYRLYYDGSATSGGAKSWMVIAPCEVTIDAIGGLGLGACEAAYSAP